MTPDYPYEAERHYNDPATWAPHIYGDEADDAEELPDGEEGDGDELCEEDRPGASDRDPVDAG